MRLLKVPEQPHPPAGAKEVETFRAARNFFRYKLLGWLIAQVGAVIGLVVGLFFVEQFIGVRFGSTVANIARFFELLGWITFVAQLPFTYLMLRLDYELRWYIVTDRSIRIREGLLTVDEKTMTFANIQNMTIRQGPIQRFLGISDLEIRTAGGGGKSEPESAGHAGADLHTAYFRGVDNAEAIRDLVRDRVRLYRDAGLGDPDDAAPAEKATAVDAARELLDECRKLRAAITG